MPSIYRQVAGVQCSSLLANIESLSLKQSSKITFKVTTKGVSRGSARQNPFQSKFLLCQRLLVWVLLLLLLIHQQNATSLLRCSCWLVTWMTMYPLLLQLLWLLIHHRFVSDAAREWPKAITIAPAVATSSVQIKSCQWPTTRQWWKRHLLVVLHRWRRRIQNRQKRWKHYVMPSLQKVKQTPQTSAGGRPAVVKLGSIKCTQKSLAKNSNLTMKQTHAGLVRSWFGRKKFLFPRPSASADNTEQKKQQEQRPPSKSKTLQLHWSQGGNRYRESLFGQQVSIWTNNVWKHHQYALRRRNSLDTGTWTRLYWWEDYCLGALVVLRSGTTWAQQKNDER